jgi:hypothetical protein
VEVVDSEAAEAVDSAAEAVDFEVAEAADVARSSEDHQRNGG